MGCRRVPKMIRGAEANGEPETKPDPKHTKIHHAFRALELLKENAEGLLAEIKGGEVTPKEDSSPRGVIQKADPSLEEILTTTPLVIKGYAEEIIKIFSEIRNALFWEG